MTCLNGSLETSDVESGTRYERPHGRIICLHCEEPILESEAALPLNNGTLFMHRECMFRQVAGSVGHQRGQCMCHNIEDTSEDGLTLRESARRALAYWRTCHDPLR
jgi:hypothetical protein